MTEWPSTHLAHSASCSGTFCGTERLGALGTTGTSAARAVSNLRLGTARSEPATVSSSSGVSKRRSLGSFTPCPTKIWPWIAPSLRNRSRAIVTNACAQTVEVMEECSHLEQLGGHRHAYAGQPVGYRHMHLARRGGRHATCHATRRAGAPWQGWHPVGQDS